MFGVHFHPASQVSDFITGVLAWRRQIRSAFIAVGASAWFLCKARPRLIESLVDSMIGHQASTEQLNMIHHDRMAPIARRVFLCLFAMAIIYHLSDGDWVSGAICVGWFSVILLTPPTHHRLMLCLRMSYYVTLTSRAALGMSYLSAANFIPPAVGIPLASALLHTSVSEHLADMLFVNAVVMLCAKTLLECVVSTVAALVTCVAVALKMKEFRHMHELQRTEQAGMSLEEMH